MLIYQLILKMSDYWTGFLISLQIMIVSQSVLISTVHTVVSGQLLKSVLSAHNYAPCASLVMVGVWQRLSHTWRSGWAAIDNMNKPSCLKQLMFLEGYAIESS